MLQRPVATESRVTPKKKRRSQPMGNLTNLQKRQLCIKFAQVKMTQQELCHWAKREFQLTHLPHQSTISKILARSDELTQMAPRDLSARRKGLVTHPELDTALRNWVLCARQNGTKLSGDMIKGQARSLAAQLGLASTMSFSNGWLGGFKKRYNIRLGTAAAALERTTACLSSTTTREHVQTIARVYDPRDVYGMHETGLYYALRPEKPTGRGRAARRESCGDRLTVVLTVNADASDRVEPLVIGTVPLLAPKDDVHGDAVRVHVAYQHNPRAWMTPVLFQDYVAALDTRMRDQGRYILLLVSLAPSHVTLGLELTNVRLEVLPSLAPLVHPSDEHARLSAASESIAIVNPTSEAADAADRTRREPAGTVQVPVSAARVATSPIPTLQPFEAGLITAFKRRYRRYHMLYALDRFEAGRQHVFEVTQVQAMRWVRHCWRQEMTADVITTAWAATGLGVPPPVPCTRPSVGTVELMEQAIETEICDTVAALEIGRPLPMDEFVSPRDEDMSLHCAGVDDTDFVCTVPDQTGGPNQVRKQAVPPNASQTEAETVTPCTTEVSVELTPRLQALHARLEASAASATTSRRSGTATVPMSHEALVGSMGWLDKENGLGGCVVSEAGLATNEQLVACFRLLLPELDRLRFDDHTKKSIRSTFRKLKETIEQQAVDRKRGTCTTRPTGPQPVHYSLSPTLLQSALPEHELQQLHQHLMLPSEHPTQDRSTSSQLSDHTVL